MQAYNLEDPVDLQRFKLNLMVGDVVGTMQDHTNGHKIGELHDELLHKFTNFVVALGELRDATTPGGKPETGGRT